MLIVRETVVQTLGKKYLKQEKLLDQNGLQDSLILQIHHVKTSTVEAIKILTQFKD